jgi:hypothetical protein
MIRALRATESESHSHNPYNFGPRLHFNAATVTKIKISPGKPYNYLTCAAIPQRHGYLSDSSEREVVADREPSVSGFDALQDVKTAYRRPTIYFVTPRRRRETIDPQNAAV